MGFIYDIRFKCSITYSEIYFPTSWPRDKSALWVRVVADQNDTCRSTEASISLNLFYNYTDTIML
jgi:hypothetical protein